MALTCGDALTLVSFPETYGLFFDWDLFPENGKMTTDQKELIEKLAGMMPVFVPDFDAQEPNMFTQVKVKIAVVKNLDPMPMLDGNIALRDRDGRQTVFPYTTFFSIHKDEPPGPLNHWWTVSGWTELASVFSAAMADACASS